MNKSRALIAASVAALVSLPAVASATTRPAGQRVNTLPVSAAQEATSSGVSWSAPSQRALLAKGGHLILRATPGRLSALTAQVKRHGGTVVRSLPIIDGVAVVLDKSSARALTSSSLVRSVAPDGKVEMLGTVDPLDISAVKNDLSSMNQVDKVIRADMAWGAGVTGRGVDIAFIDTGVAPVTGLSQKTAFGADLSLDGPFTPVLGMDAYGHGTHVASIAAGYDPDAAKLTDTNRFVGVAPDARIVNVKVGAFDGSVDVSQVIMGIDWVVKNRNTGGRNIKVLNLSFGTDSQQSYTIDPLSWAAEVAWRKGIVVVAAAGNDGAASTVKDPAYNPAILAVGAVDQTKRPFSVASFSSAAGTRQPDLWAPGSRIMGLRVPGGYLDTKYPNAVVSGRLFRGSGTSQAAAVVSGAAALLASAVPTASPDQIKGALRASVRDNTGAVVDVVRVDKAVNLLAGFGMVPVAAGAGIWNGIAGTGTLEGARGSLHIQSNGIVLTGEKDILGNAFVGSIWAQDAANETSWSGSGWTGSGWTGSGWTGSGWTGSGWTGSGWTGSGWTGSGWTGSGWTGSGWTSQGWQSTGWD